MCSSSITRLDGLAGQDLGGVLVDEVVAALDGVEHVPLPVVLLLVAEGGTHAALGGAGVGPGGIELRQDRGSRRRPSRELEGGPQARAAGTDDQGVVLDRIIVAWPSGRTFGSVITTIVPMTNSTTAST